MTGFFSKQESIRANQPTMFVIPDFTYPRFSEPCVFLFSTGVLRVWSGSTRGEGTKMFEKTGVFRHSSSIPSVAARDEESGKHRLENTVWNP